MFGFSSGTSQVNLYFLNNPIWKVNSVCAVPNPCIQNETYNYYINGDTIINTLTYKKIFKKGSGYYSWMAPPPSSGCTGSYNYIDSTPSFFLRSSGKKMFIRVPNDTNEYLLYDFNLQVGDTLPITYNNPQNTVYVSGIDSVYTPYGYLKRFSLSGNNSAQYLIEAIGSSAGLIEPIGVILECGYSLGCYSLNDTAYYPSQGPGCNLTVGLPLQNPKVNVTIFPNPFSSEISLKSELPLKNGSVILSNLPGQIVFRRDNLNGKEFSFNAGDLSPGVYLLRLVQDGEQLYSEKLILNK